MGNGESFPHAHRSASPCACAGPLVLCKNLPHGLPQALFETCIELPDSLRAELGAQIVDENVEQAELAPRGGGGALGGRGRCSGRSRHDGPEPGHYSIRCRCGCDASASDDVSA